MSTNKTVQVSKYARSRPHSRDLIYVEDNKKFRVTLSKRQTDVLNDAMKNKGLYYMDERYSYTESAKKYVLETSNEVLEPGEVKITESMLKV